MLTTCTQFIYLDFYLSTIYPGNRSPAVYRDFLKILMYFFIFGCVGSLLLCALFLFTGWGPLFTVVCGLLIAAASLVVEHRLWAPRVVVVHGLCCPTARGIFPSWDWTHVPCTVRQILNHWTTRESSSFLFTGTEFPTLWMFWYILRWN